MSEFEKQFPKISNKVLTEQDRVKIARKIGQKEGWTAALKCLLSRQINVGYSVPVVLVDDIEEELKDVEDEK